MFPNALESEVAASPYLESNVSWRYSPTGFLSWNSRFGFEEAPDINTEVLSFRTGLSLIQAFSPRLRGSAGLTYINRRSTSDIAGIDSSEQTFDLNVGAEYALSKRVSLTASYVFTKVLSEAKINDYYRNRIFFGFQYSF